MLVKATLSRLLTVMLRVVQAIASPREMLLNKVPFPLPTPSIFNKDQINAFSVDTLVSDNGKHAILRLIVYNLLFE